MNPEEEIIRNLKPLSESELAELIHRLYSPEIRVSGPAEGDLTRLARYFPDETSPYIYKAFLDPENKPIRRRLARILRLSLKVEWFKPILELLWSPAKDLGDFAFRILQTFGQIPHIKLDNRVLDQLLDYLNDPDEIIRERIGQLIADYFRRSGFMLKNGWEPLSAAQVARIIELAGKVERPVRKSLLRVLDSPVEAYQPAVPLLIKSLKDIDSEIVIASLRSLIGIGPDTAYQSLDLILDLLDHPHIRVRQQTALALERLGRAEPRIMEALLEATFDRDSGVKRSAIGALGRLSHEEREKDPDVIERLLELTFDKDERVREKAAVTLGSFEMRDNLVINRLTELLRDRDITVRGTAIDALARVGNRTHLPLLKKFITPEPVYDIYDSDLAVKAKNAFEQVANRNP
jgi:HEAT repeat protein